MNKPLRGEKLAKAVLNQILQHPETWDQNQWHCGTKHCFAGWSQILGGSQPDMASVQEEARTFLGIERFEADELFGRSCSLNKLYRFAANYNSEFRTRYNRDGYDRNGYDRTGYDRDGYDRDGYNRAGYDPDGYDRDGYNRAGQKLPLFEL
jgi:hypothetical protein